MNYYQSYARLTKQKRKKIIKKISIIGGLLFIFSVGFSSLFFLGLPFTQADTEQSTCKWYEYVEIPGSNSTCEEYIELGLTESECGEMPTNSPCPPPMYTPAANASIFGCKYNDVNNNNQIDQDEETISGWEINLFNGTATTSQSTGQDGCYTFTGLMPGTYTVSETLQDGWEQTYPTESSWTVELAEGENADEKHFANYFPVCNNSILDDGEDCEIGDLSPCQTLYGYVGEKECGQDCLGWGECQSDYFCGDNIINGLEECDHGLEGSDDCTSECTVIEQELEPICGNDIKETGEDCDGDEPIVCTASDGYSGYEICENCQWTNCESEEFCGDGVKNGNEDCDGQDGITDGYHCADQCTLEADDTGGDDGNDNQNNNGNTSGGGGGGGFVGLLLNIKNTQAAGNVELNSITITWLTSHLATSRVVYDTVPHPIVGDPPNYGYAYSTKEDPNKVTGHSVTITGLIPETAYYFRPISHGSPEVYGQEITFTTTGFGNGVGGELIDEELTDTTSQEVEEVIVLGVENIPDSEADAENNSEENTEVLAASGMGADEYALLIITMVALAGFAINLKIKYAADFGPSSTMFYKPINSSKKYHRSHAIDKYPDLYKVKR